MWHIDLHFKAILKPFPLVLFTCRSLQLLLRKRRRQHPPAPLPPISRHLRPQPPPGSKNNMNMFGGTCAPFRGSYKRGRSRVLRFGSVYFVSGNWMHLQVGKQGGTSEYIMSRAEFEGLTARASRHAGSLYVRLVSR